VGEEQGARTSSSCPLLFPLFYLALRARIQTEKPELMRELDLSWAITQRAATLLEVEPSQVEPIQVLRYEPGEFYRVHHDHHGYYDGNGNDGDGGSGGQKGGGEDRPLTMLLFLSDVEGGGGELRFPKLGFDFLPKQGDAVLWSNVHRDTGEADPDMVHEGRPPAAGQKFAANIWVRSEPITSPQQLANSFKTS